VGAKKNKKEKNQKPAPCITAVNTPRRRRPPHTSHMIITRPHRSNTDRPIAHFVALVAAFPRRNPRFGPWRLRRLFQIQAPGSERSTRCCAATDRFSLRLPRVSKATRVA